MGVAGTWRLGTTQCTLPCLGRGDQELKCAFPPSLILFLLTHMHTYTHTVRHTHAHTHTHTHTHTHIHTHTHTHTHTWPRVMWPPPICTWLAHYMLSFQQPGSSSIYPYRSLAYVSPPTLLSNSHQIANNQ